MSVQESRMTVDALSCDVFNHPNATMNDKLMTQRIVMDANVLRISKEEAIKQLQCLLEGIS